MKAKEASGNANERLPDRAQLIRATTLRDSWSVSAVTLWRWERTCLLHPVRIGRMKFYKLAEVQRLATNGTGKKGATRC
ncbi:MAG: hypothetical protein WA117_21305 [Verrucomicrobiia bacterium]